MMLVQTADSLPQSYCFTVIYNNGDFIEVFLILSSYFLSVVERLRLKSSSSTRHCGLEMYDLYISEPVR